MKPADQKIYLASKSPRRRELLRQIGVEFELLLLREDSVRGPDVSEIPHDNEPPEQYVERVTCEKALCARQVMLWRRLPIRPVLAADTTVTIDGRILGKPTDMADAVSMLRLLSGKTHQVLTSVAIHHDDQTWQSTQRSDVTFAKIPDRIIESYCTLPEPYDKAGSYAVQGQAAVFIQNIVGSYSGIMGLPLFETAQLLQQAGIKIL